MLKNLMKLFIEKDLSLLEINPLVITSGGLLHCLDAKINIDSNAIYRQPEIAEMHDPSQEDPRESEAAKNGSAIVAGISISSLSSEMIRFSLKSGPKA